MTPKMTASGARNRRLSTVTFQRQAAARLPPSPWTTTILHPPSALSHPPELMLALGLSKIDWEP
ncbi:hypothetical protein N7467_007797 [Penicillium canescens]|nr:hypothetical protein N7467_007797 [Penicillium canescens]